MRKIGKKTNGSEDDKERSRKQDSPPSPTSTLVHNLNEATTENKLLIMSSDTQKTARSHDMTPRKQRPSETHWETPSEERDERTPWFTTTLLSVLLAVVVLVGSVVVENLGLALNEDVYSTAMVVVDGTRRGGLLGGVSAGLRKIKTSIVNVIRPMAQRLPLGMGQAKRVYSTAVTVHEASSFFRGSDGGLPLSTILLVLASVGGLGAAGMTIIARIEKAKSTRK